MDITVRKCGGGSRVTADRAFWAVDRASWAVERVAGGSAVFVAVARLVSQLTERGKP